MLIATRNGAAIRFNEQQIRSMGRTAQGVRAIKLREGDCIVGACKIYDPEMTILTVTDKGMGRRTLQESYRVQNRGGMGLLNYKAGEEKGYVCGIRSLGTDDDVILISTDGIIIRIRANDLRTMGRYAAGVRVMRLTEDNRVVTFSRTEHDETADIEQVEQASEEEIAAAEAEEKTEVVVEEEPVSDEE